MIDSFIVNRADSGNPKFWSRVCLHNMAKLAREATTVRRVLEALFRYFDQGNLWSPDHGLALSVLLDMQSIMEKSGLFPSLVNWCDRLRPNQHFVMICVFNYSGYLECRL